MTESTLTLWEETALKVRELQVRFDAFETENKISGNGGDGEPPQLTLEEVYNMYQSQPRTEEEWEEMNKAIKAAMKYEASLPSGTKTIRLARTDDTSGSPQ